MKQSLPSISFSNTFKMGCFSWIAQNSERSIIMDGYGTRKYPCRTSYMWDNKGRRWRQETYEGYGVFGDKDYYVLLAEMNKEYGPDVDEETKRKDGIDLEFGTVKGLLYPNLTDCKEWTWKNEKPQQCSEQGSCDWQGTWDQESESEDENDYDSRRKHVKKDKFDGWENGETKP